MPRAVTVEVLGTDTEIFFDVAEHYARTPGFVLLDTQSDDGVSFLSFAPFATLRSKAGRTQFYRAGTKRDVEGRLLETIDELLATCQVNQPDGPHRGWAGAVGYIGYEVNRLIEVLPQTAADDLKLPDCLLSFYNFFLILDRRAGELRLSHVEGFAGALSRADVLEAIAHVARREEPPPSDGEPPPLSLATDFTKDQYLDAVRRVKEYIAAGDVYQVNLTQRFKIDVADLEPWDIYRALTRVNPAPFAAYLHYRTHSVVSASPELFLRVRGRHVETRPIKGTIARGGTAQEEAENRGALFHSSKNRAELAMIVDLLRNDLGRVSTPNSVHVSRFPELETYPSLHHLVTTIESELTKECSLVDLIRATFPGGSITGAPKIRAMEIIDELEPVVRNVYTGSIAYLGFDGTADLNIAIRTIVVKDGTAYVHAGGGIVIDSDPEDEYQESLLKASRLFEAIRWARLHAQRERVCEQ